VRTPTRAGARVRGRLRGATWVGLRSVGVPTDQVHKLQCPSHSQNQGSAITPPLYAGGGVRRSLTESPHAGEQQSCLAGLTRVRRCHSPMSNVEVHRLDAVSAWSGSLRCTRIAAVGIEAVLVAK